MPTVPANLPNDGDAAVVAPYNAQFLAILALINGGIDQDNIKDGSITFAKLATMVNSIPASYLTDSASLEKYRDELNVGFVASGMVWTATSGFNAAMTAGVLYSPNGLRFSISSIASRTFTASKDTYVDFPPTGGSPSYVEVANGAAEPALTTDYVRVAKVVTNGSTVTSVTLTALANPAQFSNPYKFSVYRNAAFVTGTATPLVTQYDTKIYDTSNNVDIVTNKGRFIAPASGFYDFEGSFGVSSTTTVRAFASVYKNGSEVKRGYDANLGSGNIYNAQVFMKNLQLARNDYVEIYNFTGASQTGATGIGTSFSGSLSSLT